MLGRPAGAAPLWAALWALGLIAIGIPVSARLYRRMARG
jgi:hypothetical protein